MKSYLFNFFSIFGFISFLIILQLVYLINQISKDQDNKLLSKYDAIIIMSGNPERAVMASNLYKDGMSNLIFLSKERRVIKNHLSQKNNRFIYQYYLEILLKNSVPKEKIIVFGVNNKSTVDEAISLAAELNEDFKNILVVTNKYHIYRSKKILESYLTDKNIHFIYPDKLKTKWWRNKYQIQNILNELMKTILFYLFTDFDNYLSYS